MKLLYFTRKLNFGDALNKYIFNFYIPELLDEDESIVLLGIGTILGLIKPKEECKKIFVFSSGYGYGAIPEIDQRYDFICIRGPLTAKALGISQDLAITDGAVLLKGMPLEKQKKAYKWSFIPHMESEKQFSDWERIIKSAGGHYISPANEPEFVIEEILKSELIVAEAMHGAIVADTLRIPWIAARTNTYINSFKWNDWLSGIDLPYNPIDFPPVYSSDRIKSIFKKKLGSLHWQFPVKLLSSVYYFYQKHFRERIITKKFQKIYTFKTYLSDDDILDKRYKELKDKLKILKQKNQEYKTKT